MKKIIISVLIIAISLSALVSCGNNSKNDYGTKDVTYRDLGITFTIPSNMRRMSSESYDFYFYNQLNSIVFTALKVDEDFLKTVDIEGGKTSFEYVDIIIEKNNFEQDKLYYKYDEERDQHSFRYTYVDSSGYEMFSYIVVTGPKDNLWYIEMCCNQEDSATYLQSFKNWQKSIFTYEE